MRDHNREKQEADEFVREQREQEKFQDNLRAIKKMNDEFPAFLEKLKQAIEAYNKMSAEEKDAVDERFAKFDKLSKEQQQALIAKAEKLEREMAAADKRKPS